MEELLGVCDRVVVMNRGQIVAEFPRAEATQERILQYAASDASTSSGS
jgi:putative multiple sugar transport system ATP-binding protein